MRDKIYYNGIYGEDSIDLVREIIHISELPATLKHYDYNIKPHAHRNLFQIFLIEEGKVEMNINDDLFEIDGPTFFTIPKNVLHGIKTTPNTKGYIINLSDIALERMLALDTNIIFAIDEVTIAKIDFNDILFNNLYTTMHKCIDEYYGNLPAKDFALEYLVGMLLIRLYRIPKVATQTVKSFDNAYKIYYRRFLQLIKENHSFKKTIQEYAAELTISTGHLNRICQSIAGKSPKDIITEYFISEAKKSLEVAGMSVADTSYQLGFEDPSYFTRLFKSKTGHTPNAYRKQIGVK